MKSKAYLWYLVQIAFACLVASPGTAAIKDAESASHGTDASQHQIVDTYRFTRYELVQINLPVLSHYSYLLISDGKTLIIDPGRDVQFYSDLIKEKSLSVSGIFLTHSHADFVAGHMELVKLFNCPIYQSAKSGAKYKIEPVVDGYRPIPTGPGLGIELDEDALEDKIDHDWQNKWSFHPDDNSVVDW